MTNRYTNDSEKQLSSCCISSIYLWDLINYYDRGAVQKCFDCKQPFRLGIGQWLPVKVEDHK